MTNTTTSTLDNLLKNFFVPKALIRLTAETPLYGDAIKAEQPKGNSKITYWNAWNNFAPVSCALSEGSANTLAQLSSRRVYATIAQYGRGFQLTDLAQLATALDSVTGAMESLTESAGRTLERVCQMGIFKADIAKNQNSDVMSVFMSSPVSAFCANTGTMNASNKQFQFPGVFGTSCTRLSAVDKSAPSVSSKASIYSIRKVVQALRAKNAKPFGDGYFHGYAHPNFLHMLLSDPTFREWNQPQFAGQTMHQGVPMPTLGVKWRFSTDAPRYAVTAHSVIPAFVYGQQAYGITTLDGGIKTIIASGPDSSDPFDQVKSLAYKVNIAAAALNPSSGRILFVHELL